MNLFQKKYFPIISCVILAFMLLFTVTRQTQIKKYRDNSVVYEIVVDLHDDASLQELDKLSYSVEQETYQKVYNEIIDSRRRLYKMKVRIPPEDLGRLNGILQRENVIEGFTITQ